MNNKVTEITLEKFTKKYFNQLTEVKKEGSQIECLLIWVHVMRLLRYLSPDLDVLFCYEGSRSGPFLRG